MRGLYDISRACTSLSKEQMKYTPSEQRLIKRFEKKFVSDIEGLGKIIGSIPICPENFIFAQPIIDFLIKEVRRAYRKGFEEGYSDGEADASWSI